METSNRGRPSKLGKQHSIGDRIYTEEETEFLMAVQRFKERIGTRFPAASEYLAILKGMGYNKKKITDK